MILRYLTLSICLLFSIAGNSFSQEDSLLFVGNIVNDTNSLSDELWKSNLTPLLKSKNQIEVRLINSMYGCRHSNGEYEVHVLSYSNGWKYEKIGFTRSKDSIISSRNLEDGRQFFSKLVEEQVFALPDQDSANLTNYTTQYDLKNNEFYGTGVGSDVAERFITLNTKLDTCSEDTVMQTLKIT